MVSITRRAKSEKREGPPMAVFVRLHFMAALISLQTFRGVSFSATKSIFRVRTTGPPRRWAALSDLERKEEAITWETVKHIKNAKAADWKKAADLVCSAGFLASDPTLHKFATCAAISTCGRGSVLDDAACDTALRLFHMVRDPDLPLFHATLGALSFARRGKEAEAFLFGTMAASTPLDSRSVCLALGACRNDWVSCVGVMERALRVIEAGEGGCQLNVGAYIAVIRACGDAGAFTVARKWLLKCRTAISKKKLCVEVGDLESMRDLDVAVWRQWCCRRIGIASASIDNDFKLNLCAAVDPKATTALFSALGTAADEGSMPSFQDPGARSGYFVNKFGSRSTRVADFLAEWDIAVASGLEESYVNAWQYGAVRFFLLQSTRPRLLSIGSGPGFDAAGVALLVDSVNIDADMNSNELAHSLISGVDATLLDYENGWFDCIPVLERALNANTPKDVRYQCSFGQSDITKPLCHHANSRVLEELGRSEPVLVISSYVVAENAAALRDDNFVFFADIAQQAPLGSMLLYIETTHRLWPEILRASFQGVDSDLRARSDLNVTFLRIRGKRGVAMGLQKVPSPHFHPPHTQEPTERVNGENAESIRMFEEKNRLHESRLARQRNKRASLEAEERSQQQQRKERLAKLVRPKTT